MTRNQNLQQQQAAKYCSLGFCLLSQRTEISPFPLVNLMLAMIFRYFNIEEDMFDYLGAEVVTYCSRQEERYQALGDWD